MKNINYFLLGSILLLMGACNEYLDVRPENKIILENMWQKESDVEAVLLACYRGMQENDYKDHEKDGFMDRIIVWGEFRSDNVIAGGSAADAEIQINDVNILPTNDDCSWVSFYKVINYCNTVLKYAPDVLERDPNFTESDLQVKEAEALGIRALCYFYLVRAFRDVPWVDEATVADDQPLDVAQSAPEVVLEKITGDLLRAEAGALSVYPTVKETKGRMTKDAIRAILADVYLWRENYTGCVEYCDKLINATTITNNFSGIQEEVPKYELLEEDISSEIFMEGNSSESIFELQFSTEKSNEAVTNFYGNSDEMGQMTANKAYAEGTNVFLATDDRKADFIVLPKKSTTPEYYKIFKYLGNHTVSGDLNNYSYKQTTANWIFYRITDIMLMKAEALVQLNRSEDDLRSALHIVNTTYMRANPTLLESDSLTVASFTDPAPLEKLVLLERQRELMFEGKRWFDLVRLSERKNSTEDLVSYVLNKYTANISTIRSKLGVLNALYFPIHADELKVNALLKQNPYYETSTTIEKN